MSLPKILTAAEVAEYLKCDPSTVHRMIRAGKLRAVKVGTGQCQTATRVTESALLEYLGEGSAA